jgi:hypothetical protein
MSEDKPPVFFIPGCQPEEQEELCAAMAGSCSLHVPGPSHHPASIAAACSEKSLIDCKSPSLRIQRIW